MAISLLNQGGRPNTNYMEFFCDNLSDMDLLPTTTRRGIGEYNIYGAAPIGSSCYCFENKEAYLLSSNGWETV